MGISQCRLSQWPHRYDKIFFSEIRRECTKRYLDMSACAGDFVCPEGCAVGGAIRGYCDICGSPLVGKTATSSDNTTYGHDNNIQQNLSAITMDRDRIVIEGNSEGMLDFLREIIGEEFVEIMASQTAVREKPINKDFLSTLGKVILDDRKTLLHDCSLKIGPITFMAIPASFNHQLPFQDVFDRNLIFGLSNSIYGEELEENFQNNDCCNGKIICLKRGKTTFVHKLKLCHAVGAAALIVLNTNDIFPFIMTNSDSSIDLSNCTTPVVMLSKYDSEIIEKMFTNKEKRVDIMASLVMSTDISPDCSICHELYETNEELLKLPCRHTYHYSCVSSWLESHNTCPMCRRDFPSQTVSDVSRVQRNNHNNSTHMPYFR